MDHLVIQKTKDNALKKFWLSLKTDVEYSANYYATGSDIALLGKLMGDLGFAGTKTYIKYYNGKPHFILKGYPGLRKILTGTKYGAQNVKIVQMGLGKYGAINAAKGGGILSVILISTYRVIDYFLTDSITLAQLIGTLSTDVVKVGIVTGASILAASAAGTTAGTAAFAIFSVGAAFAPLAVAIVIGIGVSFILNKLDEKHQITDKSISMLEEFNEKKQAIISKGEEKLNSMVNSVIDYAVENIEDTVSTIIQQLLHRAPALKT